MSETKKVWYFPLEESESSEEDSELEEEFSGEPEPRNLPHQEIIKWFGNLVGNAKKVKPFSEERWNEKHLSKWKWIKREELTEEEKKEMDKIAKELIKNSRK